MPGTNLNLALPQLTDTMAVIVAKIATALSAIQTDLAPRITPSQLNINAALSLSGNALTQVTSVQLAAGNQPGVPGSLYYASGEFWAIDSTGTPIQLTANGSINIGGTGGFVGDYVASNPTGAAYDLASGQFRFTKSVGVWADLVAAHAILQGANGSVQLGVDAAINTARLVNFKSLPSSGVSLLVYNGGTSTVEDGAVTVPTNPLPSITIGTLTTTSDRKHTDLYAQTVALVPEALKTSVSTSPVSIVSTGAGWAYQGPPIIGLRTGDRITNVTAYLFTGGGAGSTVQLSLKKQFAGVTTTIQTWTMNTVTPGINSFAVTSPAAIGTGEQWFFAYSSGTASGVAITEHHVFYDHP